MTLSSQVYGPYAQMINPYDTIIKSLSPSSFYNSGGWARYDTTLNFSIPSQFYYLQSVGIYRDGNRVGFSGVTPKSNFDWGGTTYYINRSWGGYMKIYLMKNPVGARWLGVHHWEESGPYTSSGSLSQALGNAMAGGSFMSTGYVDWPGVCSYTFAIGNE